MTLVVGVPVIAGKPAVLDTAAIARARFGNDAAWYAGRIPFFESADPTIDTVYYYRWALFRAHQRDLGADGFISTEFLDDVGWQLEPYASLNDATGFHLGEGRWLRDRRYADDYIDFMYRRGNDRHFTDYMAVNVAKVQAQLPPGTALIEFVRMNRHEFQANGKTRLRPAHYFAFVLTPGKAAPRLLDLGAAKEIDEAVRQRDRAANGAVQAIADRRLPRLARVG